jgi:hypothetical protein
MQTLTVATDYLLMQFVNQIDSFPASELAAIGSYDTAKLINILREKEVLKACKAIKDDWEVVNQIDISFGKVVKELVSEKHLQQSYQEYLELERNLENKVSGDLYIYAKQAALSVKALYFYKNSEAQKAISTTLECIVLNEYLITLGIGTLNLRCFEQNKNISRILLKAGSDEAGYSLIFNLLNYLLSGTATDLYGNLFKDSNYWNIVPILRETYAYELFSMFSEDMIRFNINNKTAFLPRCWFLDLEFEVNTAPRQMIYNWIYINKQLAEGNYEEYVSSMIYFFEQPASVFYDVMKMVLLIDLVKLARQCHCDESKVSPKIASYIMEKLQCNEKMRKFVVERAL